MIPPLPTWTGPRLEELSEARTRSVAESGVRVLGDPDLLRYSAPQDTPDLEEPPSVLPTQAAAGAIEHALAGMVKREKARDRRRAASAAPTAPVAPPADPLTGLSSRALLREIARRQSARLRPKGTR
jgi:hypothetical protein